MTDIEKATLERRIDELCAEVERLHADKAHWELGNCPSCPNVVSLQEALEQNAKLRVLCMDLHALCYPQSYEWEVTDHTYEKYSPCELCEKAHGGKSPCASTSKDLTEECCKPFQAEVVADRMRDLGIEVTA